MFQYFWLEGDQLPEGIGFGLFTWKHLLMDALCAAGIVVVCLLFEHCSVRRQRTWLKVHALLLLGGNGLRDAVLLAIHRFSIFYLPLHLCSTAIFVYLIHAFLPESYTARRPTVFTKATFTAHQISGSAAASPDQGKRKSLHGISAPRRTAKQVPDAKCLSESSPAAADLGALPARAVIIHQSRFREALGEIGFVLLMPGTMAALIFPDWTRYPLMNFMSLHSFAWHAMLITYPLMLRISGRIHPTIRHVWYPVVYLGIIVPPTLLFDRRFNVNYLFINWPLEGTPLEWLYSLMGKYWLIGYAILVLAVILGIYLLIELVHLSSHF